MSRIEKVKPFLFGVVVLACVLWFTLGPKPVRDLSQVTLKAASVAGYTVAADPCRGKQRCLVAYVAPWCSACHSSVGFINNVGALVKSRGNVGFKVVVGGDSEQRCAEFAKAFQTPTYLDPDSEFQSAAGFSSVPHWVLLDEKQNMIDGFAGGYSGDISPSETARLLRSKFGSESDKLL